jgi:hypothetical protein
LALSLIKLKKDIHVRGGLGLLLGKQHGLE